MDKGKPKKLDLMTRELNEKTVFETMEKIFKDGLAFETYDALAKAIVAKFSKPVVDEGKILSILCIYILCETECDGHTIKRQVLDVSINDLAKAIAEELNR